MCQGSLAVGGFCVDEKLNKMKSKVTPKRKDLILYLKHNQHKHIKILHSHWKHFRINTLKLRSSALSQEWRPFPLLSTVSLQPTAASLPLCVRLLSSTLGPFLINSFLCNLFMPQIVYSWCFSLEILPWERQAGCWLMITVSLSSALFPGLPQLLEDLRQSQSMNCLAHRWNHDC